ncbi:cytochrome c biogenesis CcdA family protein [Actinoplanes friuliensis]|uniref:Cytochrome c-type biogenesis protein n=1 Tax=Actinoplanes friuliensis DSM 7358 TaxID=1246995 RepID=U5VSF5_9ACTN|nr:cytochrome c biogenesis protein CcdA [Actinoplanes friuliensis]AGZ38556.1 cytochrome c-type biogenesis protein [Actinoplanes friuliensis DSM 7358]
MGETFADVASNGPLLLAIGAAAIAGLVSFLSPCVLPLMPGYLSYVTGLAGADLDSALGVAPKEEVAAAGSVAVKTKPPETQTAGRGRVLAGTVLFVVGFAVVFMLLATLVANIGLALKTHERTLNIVLGSLIIVLGLVFLGVVPGLQGQARVKWIPNAGLAGAPVFGALFGLSWLPCTGPTLGAVLGLATTSGQTDRAVVLALAYSLGLGIPFVLFGLFFRRLLGVFKAVRRNSRWVTRVGGVLLIAVGIALVTGGWNNFLIWLVTTFNFDAGTLL